MSIKYAVLGFLSWQPLTGYDLKKLFAGSTFFYWSGNSNQIYKTLVQLHQAGLVVNQIEQPESGPARKVYSLTEAGQAELRNWLLSAPESPQLRNSFLVQLAWADQLTSDELDALFAQYEHEVEMQAVMAREQKRRKQINPARTGREAWLWGMIADNWIGFYENELAWVQRMRQQLAGDRETA